MSDSASQSSSVDLRLAALVRDIESGSNLYALRFEPKVFERGKYAGNILTVIEKCNHCDLDTARVIYCMSFGAYQLMGYNLYELGLNSSVGRFLGDGTAQLAYFSEFLRVNHIRYTWDQLYSSPELLDKYARVYNGSPAYGALLRTQAEKLWPDLYPPRPMQA